MRAAPRHTLVFSDLHLTTAEVPDPERPLWKRYKYADLFVDDMIGRMLAHFRSSVGEPMELVLNGDVFDFDAVTDLPPDDTVPVSWLEHQRGLNAREDKSAFKMRRILEDHPEFVQALRTWLDEGHDLVFVVGNHDLDLHWAAVQKELRASLGPEAAEPGRVRFCAWFYVSNEDTLIEHGNQYDPYCLAADPLWPTIRVGDDSLVRLPFGNYASRIMINSMGLFNPHVESSWNMPFSGYVVFFYRYIFRLQPLLPITWLWTSVATLILSLRDGLLPAERDPLRLDDRVEQVADSARSTPRAVRGLFALRAHPAIFEPWRVARELWLDRVLLFLLIVFGSFQLLATLKVLFTMSAWWWLAFLVVLFPPFLLYARSVRTETDGMERHVAARSELISAVAGVNRLVLGHSHEEMHTTWGVLEVLNPGTWSPAYRDVACTEPEGRKCVVWVRPGPTGERIASVEVWNDPGLSRLPAADPAVAVGGLASPANLLG